MRPFLQKKVKRKIFQYCVCQLIPVKCTRTYFRYNFSSDVTEESIGSVTRTESRRNLQSSWFFEFATARCAYNMQNIINGTCNSSTPCGQGGVERASYKFVSKLKGKKKKKQQFSLIK